MNLIVSETVQKALNRINEWRGRADIMFGVSHGDDLNFYLSQTPAEKILGLISSDYKLPIEEAAQYVLDAEFSDDEIH